MFVPTPKCICLSLSRACELLDRQYHIVTVSQCKLQVKKKNQPYTHNAQFLTAFVIINFCQGKKHSPQYAKKNNNNNPNSVSINVTTN